MDPKHIIRALAALYIAERGGYARIASDILLDAARTELDITVVTDNNFRAGIKFVVVREVHPK